MQTLTYTERPWPDGPWMQEPDRVLWTDEASGLDCLVKRNASGGFLCGYVAVPQSHPLYGADYSIRVDDDTDPDRAALADKVNHLRVHGGLTYAAPCDGDQERGICHVPAPGDDDEVWWFGFDCAHSMDRRPGNVSYAHLFPVLDSEVYRTVEYVRSECVSRAEQLAAVTP